MLRLTIGSKTDNLKIYASSKKEYLINEKMWLIIGCGLLGSSLVKRIAKKKISKKKFLFLKNLKKNISKIKRLKLPGTLVNKLQEVVAKSNLIIFLYANE